MNAQKNYVLLLFVLTTIGGAVLAWNQYRELVDLRTAALKPEEGSDLRKRIADLERANRDLSAQLAAQRTADAARAKTVASAEGVAMPEARPAGAAAVINHRWLRRPSSIRIKDR